jgi:hypothetical protein
MAHGAVTISSEYGHPACFISSNSTPGVFLLSHAVTRAAHRLMHGSCSIWHTRQHLSVPIIKFSHEPLKHVRALAAKVSLFVLIDRKTPSVTS